jgi:hypothetical protein
MRPVIALVLAAGCTGQPVPPHPPATDAVDELTVVFTSRMDGEIEPCG